MRAGCLAEMVLTSAVVSVLGRGFAGASAPQLLVTWCPGEDGGESRRRFDRRKQDQKRGRSRSLSSASSGSEGEEQNGTRKVMVDHPRRDAVGDIVWDLETSLAWPEDGESDGKLVCFIVVSSGLFSMDEN